MEVFRDGDENFSKILPESVMDNFSIKIEKPEIEVNETQVKEKPKKRRGRPPKLKSQASILRGSHGSTVDGQWVRKDESDVGDRVKVKAECEPEVHGCNSAGIEIYSENFGALKKKPFDSFENKTENNLRFNSNTSDQSILNIKEEPLDIYHGNVPQDSNDDDAEESEQVNCRIEKREKLSEDEFDLKANENFIKCENSIENHDDESYSKKHDKEKSLQKRYECSDCLKSYKYKYHLSRHMNYECLMKVQKNRPRYKCSDCHVYFTTKYAMQRHYASKHLNEGERRSCNVCRKTFHDQKTLKRHFLRTNCNGAPTTTFTCKKCNKEYRHSTSVWRHMKYECEKVPRFGCAHCKYTTLQKGNIVKHFRRKHADANEQLTYNCSKCRKTYKNEYTLKRHAEFECGKEPAFACALCKFKTKRKFSLDMHIRHKHNF